MAMEERQEATHQMLVSLWTGGVTPLDSLITINEYGIALSPSGKNAKTGNLISPVDMMKLKPLVTLDTWPHQYSMAGTVSPDQE